MTCQVLQEGIGRQEADHAAVGDFLAAVEQDDARGTEQAEALHQRLVVGAVGGDVDLDQAHLFQLAADGRLRKREALHLLA